MSKEEHIFDMGSKPEQDRLTFTFQAQYQEWDASPTTVIAGVSHLVPENNRPHQVTVRLQPGDQVPVDLGHLAGAPVELVVINRTGWRHHTPPALDQVVEFRKQAAKVNLLQGGIKVAGLTPGRMALVPEAAGELTLACVGVPAVVLITVFPL